MLVAHSGRKPGLTLEREGGPSTMQAWADEILEGVEAVANVIDGDDGGGDYTRACQAQRLRLDDPERTPSARLLAAMREEGLGYQDFMMDRAGSLTEWLAARQPDGERLTALADEARQSIERQREIEAGESRSFEAHLEAYFHSA